MDTVHPYRRFVYLPAGLFSSSAIALVALHQNVVGAALLTLAMISVTRLGRVVFEQFVALGIALGIIAVTPVNTNLSTHHIVLMLIGMVAAVAVPYLLLERWRHYGVIQYKLRHGRRWRLGEILYILFPAAGGYFVGPFYFHVTGAYQHWQVSLGFTNLLLLFIGLVAVGIWDEIIFVATIGNVLRRHMPFWVANGLQAVVFSSFLYELGFQSWAVFFSYLFALVQCYIFKRTNSLLYAITIHVVFDIMLFLELIHAHYPYLLRIFVTG